VADRAAGMVIRERASAPARAISRITARFMIFHLSWVDQWQGTVHWKLLSATPVRFRRTGEKFSHRTRDTRLTFQRVEFVGWGP
jgi:hypothetical protein